MNVRTEYEHLWLQIERIMFWRIERETCYPVKNPWETMDPELNALLEMVVTERFKELLEEDVALGKLGGYEMRRMALERLELSEEDGADETSDYSLLWETVED